MAGASRRGYGEDGIYFGHRGDCRDSALHKTCAGRWRGVVSLGFDADGKRLRRKVSGQTKAEVKDKLKALHSELDAGLRTAQGYTVEKAVADWLEEGLPGRTTSVGTGYESHNLRRDFRRVTAAAGLGARWVPKELRTSFVSMMSYQGVPVEEIARLAGHASSRTTEVIYRRELRPVITTQG
jgi:integrase